MGKKKHGEKAMMRKRHFKTLPPHWDSEEIKSCYYIPEAL